MASLIAIFTILCMVGSSFSSMISTDFGQVPDTVCKRDVWVDYSETSFGCAICQSCNVTDSQGTEMALTCTPCATTNTTTMTPVKSTKTLSKRGFSWKFESNCEAGNTTWTFACESNVWDPRGYNCSNWQSPKEPIETYSRIYNSNSSECAICDYSVNTANVSFFRNKILCYPCPDRNGTSSMSSGLTRVISNPISLDGFERRFYSNCTSDLTNPTNKNLTCSWCFSCIRTSSQSGHTCGTCPSTNLNFLSSASVPRAPGMNELSMDDRIKIGFKTCSKCKKTGDNDLACGSCTNSKGAFEEPPLSCVSKLTYGSSPKSEVSSNQGCIPYAFTKCTDGLQMYSDLPQKEVGYKLKMI